MNNAVIDASVLLAAVLQEQGDFDVIAGAMMSVVNLSEVLARLHDAGRPTLDVLEQSLLTLHSIRLFDEHQARAAAALRPLTRAAGLSLGDRACLAHAMELDADVYTADRAWAALDLPCRIHLIR